MSVELCNICSPAGPSEGQKTVISQLKKILPCEFHHTLCSHEPLGGKHFKCILRLKLTTEKEASNWLQTFQDASFMTWRKLKTYPAAGRFNSYRVDLRCQHFSRPKAGTTRKKVGKDTQCLARMYMVVKRSQISRRRKSRSRDEHIKRGFMFIINLRNEHNHDLLAPASLRKRDVSKETTDTLKELYQKGHTPSTALEILKNNLREEFTEDYNHVLGDRSVCPDLNYCYRLYYNLAKQAGVTKGEDIYVNLEARLASYNEECKEVCARMQQTKDGEVVIAVCTPLIRRVHTNLQPCGQVLFVDSSVNTEETKCYLFVLLAHSTVGGLPLGVIVTSSESEPTVTAGLEVLKSLLPDGSFGGRGSKGPEVAITYDCLSLRKAISALYPTTEFMLCEVPLLQSTWRWLWNDSNDIPPNDRPALLAIATAMVYSNSVDQLEEKYKFALEEHIVKQYTGFQVHLAKVFKKRKGWDTGCNDQLLVLPEATLELSKVAMNVFMDKVLYKLKNYTLSQTVEFVLRRFDTSYKRRLVEVINKGVSSVLHSKYLPQGRDLDCGEIVQVDNSHFTVPSISSQQEHLINMEIGTCTCPLGMKGGPCKHQLAVIKKFKLPGYYSVTTISADEKSMFSVIATGKPLILKSEPSDETSASITATAVESVEMAVAQEIIAASTDMQEPPKPKQDSPGGTPDHKDHSYDLLQVTQQKQKSTLLHQRLSSAPLSHRLKRMFDTINEKIQTDPGGYKAAARSFVTNFESLETDSDLKSALYTFGKSTGEAMSAAKRHRKIARKSLQTASQLREESTPLTNDKMSPEMKEEQRK